MRRVLFIVFYLWFTGVLAQTELPSVSDFLRDVESDLAKGLPEQAKWFSNEFSAAFKSAPDSVQDTVILTVLKLNETNVKTSTGVFGYLSGVNAFFNSDSLDLNLWSGWHESILALNSNRRWYKKLDSYLELSEKLISSKIISDSRASRWQFASGQMKIGVDSLPYVQIKNGTLICYAKGDSATIRGTSGRFIPTAGKWYGEGGNVHWEGTTFNDSTQFAVLSNYKIKLSGSSFKCGLVEFHTELFDKVLVGDLTFKVQNIKSPADRIYPRFESDSEMLYLEDFFPGFDFEGGIVVKGSRLDGTGVEDEKGYLKIYQDDTLFIKCSLDEIMFRNDGFGSINSELAIYLGKDSIYHPGLSVRYDRPTNKIMFIRTEEGIGMQAFEDSYHKIEFQVEAITWNVGDPTIKLGSLLLSGRGIGLFRSVSNFDKRSYDNMMGIASIHPLSELKNFMKNKPSTSFYVSEYAYHLRLNEATVKLMLIDLALQGYVSYNEDEGWCEWLPKADNHLKCNKGRSDYDVIAFRSEVGDGANAELELKSMVLDIEGIQPFKVSEEQEVIISPKDGKIKMSEDRDFAFSGDVQAGKFEFKGSKFEFDYSSFQINLNAVEKMHIRAEIEGEYNYSGRPKTRLIRNTIDGITGTLQIDDPSNRSGWRSNLYPHYPMLTSTGPSFVYYDNYSIHKGAYHRNRFRYALDPFEIDSLDNFLKDNVRFSGELIAGGIIPDLDVDLRLMDDFSLGIESSSPPEGYALYRGLGTITADVKLNMDGLQGTGVIDYLSSHITGNDMVLVPDSSFGVTTSYVNEAIWDHVPTVEAQVVEFALHSDVEMLDVRYNQEKLKCFGEDADLMGSIHLNKEGMTADGEFEFDDARLSSDLFYLKERGMNVDTADFEIIGHDLNALAFKTQNVQADIDFDQRIGDFVSHAGVTQIELPAIRYFCTMDKFRWFMDLDQIQLENTLAAFNNENFVSSHPDQDSLSFASARALYKVDAAVVECHDVPLINVADCEVIPDTGYLVVRRDAQMDPLFKAQIITNRDTRYHRLYDATVHVKGKYEYSGNAQYIYKDVNEVEWPIYFDIVEVDSVRKTVAQAKVPISQEFYLDPYFEFTGNVKLIGERKNLEFDGGTRLAINCSDFEREWIEFSTVIDPADIKIPIEDLIIEKGKAHLDAGIMLSDDAPFKAYPLFFTKKPDRGDIPIFNPEGNLRFDKKNSRYVVSTDSKFKKPKSPGALTELPESGCGVYSSGKTTLPFDFNIIEHHFIGDAWVTEFGRIEMRGSIPLNLYMNDKLVDYLATQLKNASSAQPIDVSYNYEYAVTELAGEEEASKAMDALTKDGYFKKMPEEIRSTIVLTDLKFKYDDYEDSFISESRIGIATVDDKSIFRSIPGRVELERNRGRDILKVYFHISENHWYYFEYDTYFKFETSDLSFVEIWNKLKPKQKLLINPDSEKSLKMQISRMGLRENFVDRFRDFE
ncbi:MAG: hypothetical protein CL847_06550 [Crocinitomicaceae bacterium]|nr:hypothetical protein [Crocinitomicaceae bacterium]